jgi:Xaa-Pro aminopeptidase
MRRLRMIKSAAEVAKIETACQIAGRAFARVPEIAREGVPLEKIFRQFQMLCLEEGADYVPYLAGGAGRSGYLDVISPATESPLGKGDVLMLDTGLLHDGYFCDFDRNWSVGRPGGIVTDAYARLIEATEAGVQQARSGATAADVFHAMNNVLTIGSDSTDAGRLGHGLGMSLTEWPSLIAEDHTVLEPGMVLTLEPGVSVADSTARIMVHEENILVTDEAPRFLSPRAGREMIEL